MRALHIIRWTGFYTVLWIVLVEGDWPSLVLGIPAACLASFTTLRLGSGPWRWSMRAGVALAGHFVGELFRASVDVALRSISRQVDLQPSWISYTTSLHSVPARLFFAKAINLLPGTICGAIDGDQLDIHVLDARVPQNESLANLEVRIARFFREPGAT